MRIQHMTTVIVDEKMTYTLIEVSQQLHIPEDLLYEMEAHGLFQMAQLKRQAVIDQMALKRIEAACRLHRDLGLNLPGVVLALELLDEMEALKQRLAILERK